MMSEITDRKHLEQTLQQREQQLTEAQRVAHLGSWEWDINSNRISWSDEMYRMFGLEPGEVEPTFENSISRVHPDDRAEANHWLAAALEGQDSFEYDYRMLRADGGVVWARARGDVIRDANGAPLRMRGTALDVSASKRAEQALQETTSRYLLLQKMASASNEASNLDEVLRTAVEEICAHTDWPVGHAYVRATDDGGGLVSSGIWRLAEPERFAALQRATAQTPVRRGPGAVGRQVTDATPVWIPDVTHESADVRNSGELGVRAHVAIPVTFAGETVAVLEFFSTEALEPDQELLATLGQIATQLSRVAERQHASDELAIARDAAMESSRLKSEFLATMSHEIRTPMNGVIGLTGLLLRTELDDRQRQYAEGVQGAGEALLAIINDILDFSKIEAGKLELEVVDFDLVQVVEEAAGLVAETARRKGLELVAYCHPGLPEGLRGDPSRLRQVLLNLASNAVKFTEAGEVIVRARLVRESEESLVVRFEVADTGIGINADDQARLFEPFSQADTSTTRRFGGTGLGLAISTQLVAAMGGELGVDSEPGHGSTFWFTLPFGRPAEGVVVAARPFHHLLEGVRALVVDDNDTNRLILHDQLRAWDMYVDLADNGAVALQRIREAQRPYDLALLDMCMEEIDGLDLARRISADPALASTRLILLTSTADVSADDITRAGIAAALTKPVRLSQLYDTLMRLTAPAPAVGQRSAPLSPARAEGRQGHVLVVEDNATNQMVAVGILEDLGYRVDVAGNGLEALEALARRDYAAVLMDCQMPEMDGYTATAEIRRRQGDTGRLPVIAMTAGAVEGDRERCLAAGMDDYISKPVKPEDIEQALGRWVLHAAGERAGVATARPGSVVAATTNDGIDDERLQVLRRMGPPDASLLPRLVEAFASEAPTSLASLNNAHLSDDFEALRQGAHRLRGAAANLGATEVAMLCADLEALAATGSPGETTEMLTRLGTEIDHALERLRGFLADRA